MKTPSITESAAQIVPEMAAGAQAFAASMSDVWKSLSGLSLPLPAVAELQSAYLKQSTELWNQTLLAGKATSPAPAAPTDRRFSAQEWMANPAAAYTAQMYLLNSRTLMQMADSLQGDEKTRQRIRFAVQQWIDAASPARFEMGSG